MNLDDNDAASGVCLFLLELGLGDFAALGDEMIARLTAKQRDGLGLGEIPRNAIETTGFAVVERGVRIDFPEDLLGTLMGRTAHFLDEFLGTGIADATGEPIHACLPIELFAEGFNFENPSLLREKQTNASRIKLIERPK